MGTTKPLGTNDNRKVLKPGVVYVGCCTECKHGVFSDQAHVRVRRPTIGLNHEECACWCGGGGMSVIVDFVRLFPDDRELTRRELEVLSLFACGLSYRQIAARLGLAVCTVDCHLHSARSKLDVRTSARAAEVALSAGLIPFEVAADV